MVNDELPIEPHVETEPDSPEPVLETSKPAKKELTIQDFMADIAQTPVIAKYRSESSTVTQTQPMFKHGEEGKVEETIVVNQLPVDELNRIWPGMPNKATDERSREWIETLQYGVYSSVANGGLTKPLKREGSDFRQSVPSDTGELTGFSVGVSNTRGSNSGEIAVLRVSAALGLGGLVQIPLWHSGFWVTLKNPSESALLMLHDRIVSEKVELARTTYGRAFANFTSFFAGHVFDFIMDHVYDSTLNVPLDELRSHILVNDLHMLAWGIASIIWPDGWAYRRPVVGNPDDPYFIADQKIRIGSMCWTDVTLMSDQQRTHMSRRRGEKMSLDQVKLYRSQFPNRGDRVVDLSKQGLSKAGYDAQITLSVPTVDEYVNTGTRWVNDIVAMYDSISGVQGGPQARNSFVTRHTQATILRMYEHWVSNVIINDDVTDNRDDLRAILDNVSTIDEVRDLIIKEVMDYIDDTTVSLIGIASEDQDPDDVQMPKFPFIIPVDPLYLFFTQLVQKVDRILIR